MEDFCWFIIVCFVKLIVKKAVLLMYITLKSAPETNQY